MAPPACTLSLKLMADGQATPLEFPVFRMVNAGYVGRDRQAVMAHIEELRREGIAPPPAVPMLYPVLSDNVTTAEQIEVIGDRTSGEIEFVLLVRGQEVLVGVGSDHTDRSLEAHDVIKSKQICRNVLARQVWRYNDVRPHWDQLVMRSWVAPPRAAGEILYQQSSLSTILNPEQLLELALGPSAAEVREGLLIFGGTVAVLGGELRCGGLFRGELHDPVLNRRISFQYGAVQLDRPRGQDG